MIKKNLLISGDEARFFGVLYRVFDYVIKLDSARDLFEATYLAHIATRKNVKELIRKFDNGDDYCPLIERGMAISMMGIVMTQIGKLDTIGSGAPEEFFEVDDDKRLDAFKNEFDGEDPSQSFKFCNKILGMMYRIRQLVEEQTNQEIGAESEKENYYE